MRDNGQVISSYFTKMVHTIIIKKSNADLVERVKEILKVPECTADMQYNDAWLMQRLSLTM